MVVVPFQVPRILQGASPSQRLLSEHGARLAHYQELRDFYAGIHFPTARRGRTNLVANYARAIVDKHVAFTFARGVLLQGPETPEGEQRGPLESALAEILEGTAFSRALLQAGTNASVLGDAILKVIWDGTRIRVLNIDPSRFFPTFRSDDPAALREVAVASSITPEEAAERYGLHLGRSAELLERWTTDLLTVEVGATTVFRGVNPYPFIPYVHIPNLAPPGANFGLSELEDVIPLNRELEERLSDQADSIRYHADPPVVFKGVREHTDLAVGPGTIWDIPADAAVDLLEWRGQLPAVDRHIERVIRALYDVSEAPRSSFGDTEQPFSGVALETQLQPAVQRTLRRRIVWEPALQETARFCLLLAEQFGVGGAQPGDYAPYRVRVQWLPMLPRDDDAEANRYIALTAAGLRSHTTAMEALGVADPAAELARVERDRGRLHIETDATPEESGVRFIPASA